MRADRRTDGQPDRSPAFAPRSLFPRSLGLYASRLVAQLTGAEGPLRAVLDRLRRLGLGERVLETAIAVSLSWELARLTPGNPNPVLAAMTGIFSINLTIASSVTDAVQRLLGVVRGLGVAHLVSWLLGISGGSLALVARDHLDELMRDG